jgi:hypothetical protein
MGVTQAEDGGDGVYASLNAATEALEGIREHARAALRAGRTDVDPGSVVEACLRALQALDDVRFGVGHSRSR